VAGASASGGFEVGDGGWRYLAQGPGANLAVARRIGAARGVVQVGIEQYVSPSATCLSASRDHKVVDQRSQTNHGAGPPFPLRQVARPAGAGPRWRQRQRGKRMRTAPGKFAVVTGGRHRMGRELVRQLTPRAQRGHVETFRQEHGQTIALLSGPTECPGRRASPPNRRPCRTRPDVAFRDEACAQHDTGKLHLLFQQRRHRGGGPMIADSRARTGSGTFNVWGGVYFGCAAHSAHAAGGRRGANRQHLQA